MKLFAIVSALACANIEPIHGYHKLRLDDVKWGVERANTYQMLNFDCKRVFRGESVEVLEENASYPFILKFRYDQPNELIIGPDNQILGRGKSYELYGDALDFAEQMPPLDLPKPSAKLVEQRKRIEALRKDRGL